MLTKTLGTKYTLAHTHTAVTSAIGAGETGEQTHATVTIPAGSMGLNGGIRVSYTFAMTNSANNKTLRIKFGGTNIIVLTHASAGSSSGIVEIGNRGAANSQFGSLLASRNPGAITASQATASIDTSANVTMLITSQKALGTETVTLEYMLVELIQ